MRKYLLITAGFACLTLGAIGVLFPILPTTPFVLLAGTCFAASNPGLLEKLKHLPMVGAFVTHYSQNTGVPLKEKVLSITVLWAGLIFSMFFIKIWWVEVLLVLIGIAVTIHIVLIARKH